MTGAVLVRARAGAMLDILAKCSMAIRFGKSRFVVLESPFTTQTAEHSRSLDGDRDCSAKRSGALRPAADGVLTATHPDRMGVCITSKDQVAGLRSRRGPSAYANDASLPSSAQGAATSSPARGSYRLPERNHSTAAWVSATSRAEGEVAEAPFIKSMPRGIVGMASTG